MVVPLLVQVLQLAHTVSEALDARGADDVPAARRSSEARVTGRVLTEIWLTPRAAAAPMRRGRPRSAAVAGVGLDGDRYALGGGTWARYPDLEKQLTLIDADDVAAVAAETGVELTPGDTRRNLVTTGIGPARAGRAVVRRRRRAAVRDEALPAVHAPGTADRGRLVKAMVAPRRDQRGGVRRRARSPRATSSGRCRTTRPPGAGAPTGADRPVPRLV